jgi:hypothetical protein
MLLWKSWRDLRIAFFVGLGWLALEIIGALMVLFWGGNLSLVYADPDQSVPMIGVFIGVQTFIFTLLAFGMGTFGVGRDIGAGSGSFLLTRPIRRGFFVWTEWLAGLIALTVLLMLAVLDLWVVIRCHAFRLVSVTTSGGTTTSHAFTLTFLPVRVAFLYVLCAFLFLALVFAITHLGTVAFRHSTAGLLFSLGFFVGWLIVTTIFRFKYPGIAAHIPDLFLRPFGSNPEKMHLVPGFASSILVRLAILPLFPLAAHFCLRRTEV